MIFWRARHAPSSTGFLLVCALALGACQSQSTAALDAALQDTRGSGRALSIGDAEERFQPALEALRAAVDAGNEREARAVLERLYLAEPTGTALDIARAYEKILDGRAVVASLALTLEAAFERDANGAGTIVVWLSAATSASRPVDVAPGPCTLHVTQTAVDAAGDETKSLETITIASPIRVLVSNGAPVRIPLAHMPFGARKGALASRATFDLEARAGSVTVDERELPAQRFQVASSEVVLLASELAGLELTRSGALAEHVADGKCDPRAALSIAVRMPRTERAAALDALAGEVEALPTPALERLAPALRWLVPEENLGRDARTWRSFLRKRAEARSKRPELLLPRQKDAGLAGT